MRLISMIFPRSCLITLLCTSIIIITLMISVLALHQDTSHFNFYAHREMEVIEDLPKKSDIDLYIHVLEKMISYVNGHRFYVDLNLCFGLFLINVVDIYRNESTWISHLKTFNTQLLKKTQFISKKRLERTYSKWSKYIKRVLDVDKSHLSPEESDVCLNPVNFNEQLAYCHVPYSCTQLVQKGMNYGYEMTHRLLFLITARFSRGCVILSLTEDKKLIDNLCAKMFNEAEYIAGHHFKLPDLLTQQISLCSLEGHAQFLQRSWLEELMELQIGPGCFNLAKSEKVPTSYTVIEDVDWQFVKDDQILGGMCNSHITAAAGIMVASAIRYIMEYYF